LRVIKKKLKSRFGFSLAETLIAILILLMVSAIVGAAIPTASRVYVDTVDAANAQVLLSTATTVLRDKLSTATSPRTGGAGDKKTIITFKTRTTVNGKNADAWCMIEMKDGTLYIHYGSLEAAHEADVTKYTIGSQKLVSLEAKTQNLSLIYDSITYNETTGVVTFRDLQVMKGDKTLAGPCDISVRTLS
jgi:type II secretory pathway pseudopilin PulG